MEDPKEPTRVRPMWLWVIGGVLLLAVISAGAYYLGKSNNPTVIPTISPTDTATTKPTSTPTSTTKPTTSAVTPVTDEGVTWLSEPQKLGDLGLVKAVKDDLELKGTTYYKIGTDNGKDIVILITTHDQGNTMGLAEGTLHFLDSGAGKYQYLTTVSTYPEIREGDSPNVKIHKGFNFTDKVSGNNSKVYNSVTPQEKITINGVELKSARTKGYHHWFPTLEQAAPTVTFTNPKIKEYGMTPYGKIYTVSSVASEGNYTVQFFLLRHFNHMAATFDLRPAFMKDDNVPAVTWNDGMVNKDTYRLDFMGGCGFPYGVGILENAKSTDFKIAGKTSTNETVYDFTDKNNATVQKFYKAYSEYKQGEAISLDEYMKRHGVFAYKDGLGRYVLFVSTVYGIDAECGGPYYGVF